MILKAHGVVFGKNLQIPGKVLLLIRGARITIGDNFYLSSGNGVNPIASNLQADVYVEPGAALTIGNNVGMSSTRLWIHESARIGNNVKIGLLTQMPIRWIMWLVAVPTKAQSQHR